MLTYVEELAKSGGNLSLDEYKRLCQEQCRQDVKAGIVSEESMHFFNRATASKIKIEYRESIMTNEQIALPITSCAANKLSVNFNPSR